MKQRATIDLEIVRKVTVVLPADLAEDVKAARDRALVLARTIDTREPLVPEFRIVSHVVGPARNE